MSACDSEIHNYFFCESKICYKYLLTSSQLYISWMTMKRGIPRKYFYSSAAQKPSVYIFCRDISTKYSIIFKILIFVNKQLSDINNNNEKLISSVSGVIIVEFDKNNFYVQFPFVVHHSLMCSVAQMWTFFCCLWKFPNSTADRWIGQTYFFDFQLPSHIKHRTFCRSRAIFSFFY